MKYTKLISLIIPSLILSSPNVMAGRYKVAGMSDTAFYGNEENCNRNGGTIRLNIRENEDTEGKYINLGSVNHHASLRTAYLLPDNLQYADFWYNVEVLQLPKNSKFIIGIQAKYRNGALGWIGEPVILDSLGKKRNKIEVRGISEDIESLRVVATNNKSKGWCNLRINNFSFNDPYTKELISAIKFNSRDETDDDFDLDYPFVIGPIPLPPIVF